MAEHRARFEIGTEQNRQVLCTALSTCLLQGKKRRLNHIFHHVFVHLRSALSYFSSGSYLQLVLCDSSSENDASAGEDSWNTANESEDLMERIDHTVWEDILYLHLVGLVDSCRTGQQWKSICYKRGMRVGVATNSVFRVWKALFEEVGRDFFAFLLFRTCSTTSVVATARCLEKSGMIFIWSFS